MSKLFSRTRSAATVGKNGGIGGGGNSSSAAGTFSDTDDFGRVRSMAFKRGKTDSALERSRQRTLSNPNLLNNGTNSYYGERPETPKDLPMLPDGLFLPTSLTASGSISGEHHQEVHDELGHEYGYLASESHVILGLDEVVRLVDVVAEELGQRGQSSLTLSSRLANVILYQASQLLYSFPLLLSTSGPMSSKSSLPPLPPLAHTTSAFPPQRHIGVKMPHLQVLTNLQCSSVGVSAVSSGSNGG